MAFSLHSIDVGAAVPLEYLPCGAITPLSGMALTVKDGLLAAATSNVRPEYISACEKAQPCNAGEIIPVIRVGAHQIFKVDSSADLSALVCGDKVALHAANGMDITAAKADNGPCEIVRIEGNTAYVRLV